MRPSKLVTVACLASLTVAVSALSAFAQFGPQALFAPGQSIPAAVLQNEGGRAGRELLNYLGKRPVLVVYWQPRNPTSESALISAFNTVQDVAPDVAFFPVAFLSSGQSPSDVTAALARFGGGSLSSSDDSGPLARVLGFNKLPSFALIDAGGVLRLVGGSDISQNSQQGPSIFDAVMMAQKGQPIPTLGVLNARPVYRMLGKLLPELAVTELDGKTYRKANELVGAKKRTLFVYWLPSCSHCREALPKLKDWYSKAKPDDLQIVDISRGDVDSMRQEAAAFVKDYPWNTHFLDVTAEAGKKIMAMETPSAYLVSADGEIIGIQVGGSIDWGRWLGK
ncbi:MAG: TlpA disulfide reductase family protein [Acidobacteriota bacterium]